MTRLWYFWQYVTGAFRKLVLHYFPPEARKVRVQQLGDGWSLVTFTYAGAKYRGHLPPGGRLPATPWFRGVRRSMLRPSSAQDSDNIDVTERIREYWGPQGEWNRSLGLELHLPSTTDFMPPVRVRFNDGTRRVLQERSVGQGQHVAVGQEGAHPHQV